ncbi:fibronectin type III and SPRY domain-containing protein 2 isoform X2 [Vanacampus margaritifer]
MISAQVCLMPRPDGSKAGFGFKLRNRAIVWTNNLNVSTWRWSPQRCTCWGFESDGTWSTALSCLPKYPKPDCVRCEEASKPHLPSPPSHTQGSSDPVAVYEETAQCSSACSFTVSPAEGNVELQEEAMEQSVFGLHFSLDPVTTPPSLHLSNSSLTVTYQEAISLVPLPNNAKRLMMTSDPDAMAYIPQVCADVIIAQGQYYWEVEVCNSSIYKIGVSSVDGHESWLLERQSLSFFTVYDGRRESLNTVPPQIKTIGVFLNIGGGALSFHNPVTQEHLVTLPTRFNPLGVLPTLGLGQGWLRLRCGLPPPLYVFLSKNSAYRAPCGSSRGRVQRDIPFRSVRKVIQKFEKLSASNFALKARSTCS